MLWNLVMDFYIHYIFGGVDSNFVPHDGFIGINDFSDGGVIDTSRVYFTFNNFIDTNDSSLVLSMPLGNYLSFIATIISMVVIVLICCALIKKIYNMCAHIIG